MSGVAAFSRPEARFQKAGEGTPLQARARQGGLGQTVEDTEPDHPAASSFQSPFPLCQPLVWGEIQCMWPCLLSAVLQTLGENL